MNKAQTDNSYLGLKIDLRERFLPDKQDIRVLDLFAGEGTIWRHIRDRNPDRHIKLLGIDERGLSGALRGDNCKFIPSLDISDYDIIDLDAYGVPFKQLELLFDKGLAGKRVFVTFIQWLKGVLPKKMLYRLGYTKAMIDKCPTLFYKDGFGKLCQYLYLHGVKKVHYYQSSRRYYLYFCV